MDEILKKPLSDLDDQTLFALLDATSDEVKRRNNLLGPPVIDVKNQSIEKTLGSFLEALTELGIKLKNDGNKAK